MTARIVSPIFGLPPGLLTDHQNTVNLSPGLQWSCKFSGEMQGVSCCAKRQSNAAPAQQRLGNEHAARQAFAAANEEFDGKGDPVRERGA